MKDVKDAADLAREEFIKSIKNMGFPVNVQDRAAYEKRSQGEGENSWLLRKPKEQDKPVKVENAGTNVISGGGEDDSQALRSDDPMQDQEKEKMAELKRGDYPGITSEVRHFEEAILPACTHCGSNDTASVQIGIIGRTITIACRTRKFYLIPNGPAPGKYFCRKCGQYFD